MHNCAETWWQTIPGAQVLSQRISNLMLQQTSMVLLTCNRMPWIEVLRMQVREQIQHMNQNLLIETCDLSYVQAQSPIQWVMQEFGQSVFFLPSQNTLQVALDAGLLKNRVFWVSGICDRNTLLAWVEFSRFLYRNRQRQCGCVVMLLDSQISVPTGIEQISFDKYVSEYDLAFFATALIARSNLTYWNKKYLSELAVSLSFGSAQRCAELIETEQQLIAQPEQIAGSGSEVTHAIWRAQMQTVFARIEEKKLSIIQKNEKYMTPLLGTTDDYGNIIERIEHIELRHLVHAINRKEVLLPDNDMCAINTLYDCRNRLAHHKVLPLEKMQKLFELFT